VDSNNKTTRLFHFFARRNCKPLSTQTRASYKYENLIESLHYQLCARYAIYAYQKSLHEEVPSSAIEYPSSIQKYIQKMLRFPILQKSLPKRILHAPSLLQSIIFKSSYQITSNPLTNHVKPSTVASPMPKTKLRALRSKLESAPEQVAHLILPSSLYGFLSYIPKTSPL